MFCNVHLFRVPRSWIGSVQMKSRMTFIRDNRCIEREKDKFKNDRKVKRLKECELALNLESALFNISFWFRAYFCTNNGQRQERRISRQN